MWFLTQHKRWGLLKEHPDYLGVAKQINQIELYKQAAARAEDQRAEGRRCASSKLIDGVVWDGKDPKKYADGFKVKRLTRSLRRTPWSAPSSTRRSTPAPRRTPSERARRARRRRAAPAAAAAAKRAAPRSRRSTGAALWLKVLPPLLGIALAGRHLGAADAARAARFPTPARDLRRRRVEAVRRSVLPARARTTRASAGTSCSRCSAWRSASAWRRWSASRSAS